MPTKKNTWTAEVAQKLTGDFFARKRKFERESSALTAQIGAAHPYNLDRIKAATALYRSGDLLLEHYLSAVENWSSEPEPTPSSMPERNVINWAKAFVRAETKKRLAHAQKMLRISVETLEG